MRLQILLLTLLAWITLGSSAPRSDMAILTLINKNPDRDVYVRLLGMNHGEYYYLTEPAFEHPEESVFEVRRDIYKVAVYACGFKLTGSLNMMRNLRLVFPLCYVGNYYVGAVNAGEPGMEKVDLVLSMPEDGVVDEKYLYRLNFYGKITPDLLRSLRDVYPRSLFPPYNAHVQWQLDWYSWFTGELDGSEPFFYH